MPTDILIYIIFAAIMVFWLRNTLGSKHGEERQRPNPYEKQSDDDIAPTENSKNAVSPDQSDDTSSEPHNSIDTILVQIALIDRTFDKGQFITNAADAFVIIVTAFASGDRDTLKGLCTDKVYDAFDQAIKQREDSGETLTTEIHAVRKSDITDAVLDSKRHAAITIRFTADETYVVRDKDGVITAGHPDSVLEMTDKWTFTRDLKSHDPRWLLSKTDDDVIEDDKMPIPDAG